MASDCSADGDNASRKIAAETIDGACERRTARGLNVRVVTWPQGGRGRWGRRGRLAIALLSRHCARTITSVFTLATPGDVSSSLAHHPHVTKILSGHTGLQVVCSPLMLMLLQYKLLLNIYSQPLNTAGLCTRLLSYTCFNDANMAM